MATTTNYSWTTPDDTALVKDGAAAIRSLGTAIDSTVFTNAGAAIAKTLVDAKGDLIVASGADAVARLAVGTNDHVLTADSGATNGVKWAALPAPGGMTLISTTTLTGTSVTLSSIPATYKDLQIIVRDFRPVNDNDQLKFRFNADSTSNLHYFDYSYSSTEAAAWNRNFGLIINAVDNGASDGLNVLVLWDYANTTTFKQGYAWGFAQNQATPANIQYLACRNFYKSTSAISSLEFFTDSGGGFTSGTILLYGVS